MNKSKKKKLLIGGGIALVIIILVIVNLTRSSESTVTVSTDKVKEGRLISLVTASGRVQPKTEVQISANVSGEIVSLPVVEGQRVAKGDLLVQLDPRQYDASVRQSQAGYDAALANLRLEEANLAEATLVKDRAQSLFDKGLTSKENYDAAMTRFTTTQASVEAAKSRAQQAKAAVDQARESLGYTTIRSPIDGYVTDLRSEMGEIVMGSLNYQASVIMVVSDLSEIEVEVEVDETDIGQVALDQEVRIELDAMPDTSFKGVVTEIGNSAQVSNLGMQDQVTNFMVTILVADSVPNLKPGMTATCDITTDRRTNALKIPIGAVVLRDEDILRKKDEEAKPESSASLGVSDAVADTDAGGTDDDESDISNRKKTIEGVFVIRDKRAKFVPVATGIADQQDIEITAGLQKDDEIVTGPFRTLRTLEDGDLIKVEESAKKGDKEQS
ncbi:MAG: efflux RND transporter periplasmic adaptor subunit [Candidatus Zixiibacteriota bacterium]